MSSLATIFATSAWTLATTSGATGRYVLGPAVDALRGGGSAGPRLEDVAAPVMEALAASLGETVKLVVRDALEALTIAVSLPSRDSCLVGRAGVEPRAALVSVYVYANRGAARRAAILRQTAAAAAAITAALDG